MLYLLQTKEKTGPRFQRARRWPTVRAVDKVMVACFCRSHNVFYFCVGGFLVGDVEVLETVAS